MQSFSYVGKISYGNLLYSIVSTVNNTVSYTLICKRIDTMLSVLTTPTQNNGKMGRRECWKVMDMSIVLMEGRVSKHILTIMPARLLHEICTSFLHANHTLIK